LWLPIRSRQNARALYRALLPAKRAFMAPHQPIVLYLTGENHPSSYHRGSAGASAKVWETSMHKIVGRRAVFLFIVTMFALIGTMQRSEAASAAAIDADVNATLNRFYLQVGGSRDLVNRAAGVLVFPSVVKAGIGIGGEYGEGALRLRGRSVAYYNTISASIGFQLGAQARSVIIMFMTGDALASFQRKDGWKVGVDGSVVLVTVGAAGSVDTNQISNPVIGFILDEKGLMYNLTLEGSKITRIAK
jgi:lipid-binding SYLF domain-containing protein